MHQHVNGLQFKSKFFISYNLWYQLLCTLISFSSRLQIIFKAHLFLWQEYTNAASVLRNRRVYLDAIWVLKLLLICYFNHFFIGAMKGLTATCLIRRTCQFVTAWLLFHTYFFIALTARRISPICIFEKKNMLPFQHLRPLSHFFHMCCIWGFSSL